MASITNWNDGLTQPWDAANISTLLRRRQTGAENCPAARFPPEQNLGYNVPMHVFLKLVATILLLVLIALHAPAQQPRETPANESAGPVETEPGYLDQNRVRRHHRRVIRRQAPVTVANFLHYITEKKVHNPTFYRVVRTDPDNQPDKDVKIQVLQGGLTDVPDRQLPTIKHETTEMTGILHKDGVLSMARDEPGTATHHFSICIGDQPALDFGGKRNPDGQGFAAFGKVNKGMDVVKKIHQQPAEGQYLKPAIKMLAVTIVE